MSTIPTPPKTTLSDDSDTEIEMAAPRPIYLIVATSVKPAMGIGLNGKLPWPALKKDMAFFRRVTSHVPPQASSSGAARAGPARRNAVVMGRKTWESIPRKFRPLKGRVNVVVTRTPGEFAEGDGKEVLAVESLREALETLEGWAEGVGKVFVIGGSQIYAAAMELTGGVTGVETLRILQTQARRKDKEEIHCDTFFPVRLDESTEEGWRRASGMEVQDWVDSQTVPGSDGTWEEDGEVEIRVVGWEKSV